MNVRVVVLFFGDHCDLINEVDRIHKILPQVGFRNACLLPIVLPADHVLKALGDLDILDAILWSSFHNDVFGPDSTAPRTIDSKNPLSLRQRFRKLGQAGKPEAQHLFTGRVAIQSTHILTIAMSIKALLTFAALALTTISLPQIAFAQTSTIVGNERFIEVYGDGEMLVIPDEAVLHFGVETIRTSLDDARRENDRRVAAVLQLISNSGIEDRYIQTDHVYVEPLYTYKGDRDRAIRGYNVRKNMTVTLRDVSRLEAFTSELLKAGTTNIHNYTLRSSTHRAHRDEARLSAIRAAREKAEASAAALGQKLGQPLRVVEIPLQDMYTPVMANTSMAQEARADAGSAPTFALGRVTISSRVKIAFALQ